MAEVSYEAERDTQWSVLRDQLVQHFDVAYRNNELLAGERLLRCSVEEWRVSGLPSLLGVVTTHLTAESAVPWVGPRMMQLKASFRKLHRRKVTRRIIHASE